MIIFFLFVSIMASETRKWTDIWKRKKTGRDVLCQIRSELASEGLLPAAASTSDLFELSLSRGVGAAPETSKLKFGDWLEVGVLPTDVPALALDVAHQFFGQFPSADMLHLSLNGSFETNMIQGNFRCTPDTPLYYVLQQNEDGVAEADNIRSLPRGTLRQMSIHSADEYMATIAMLKEVRSRTLVFFENLSAIFLTNKVGIRL